MRRFRWSVKWCNLKRLRTVDTSLYTRNTCSYNRYQRVAIYKRQLVIHCYCNCSWYIERVRVILPKMLRVSRTVTRSKHVFLIDAHLDKTVHTVVHKQETDNVYKRYRQNTPSHLESSPGLYPSSYLMDILSAFRVFFCSMVLRISFIRLISLYYNKWQTQVFSVTERKQH